MSSWQSYSEIEKLFQRSVTPCATLTQDEDKQLSISKTIVDENYMELDEFIDGDFAQNPIVLCHKDHLQETAFELYRLVHNYVSSLYSFNEHIALITNEKTTEEYELRNEDFIPDKDQQNISDYSRKVGFLMGLRTDCQHGAFSSFDFDRCGKLGDFRGYHLIFDAHSFINASLYGQKRYLRHTTTNEQQYPLTFVASFHLNHFNRFYENCVSWLS